jgi:nucleoid-associated protein YgaU
VEKGMLPGSYVVRADEVEPASGKVTARAEVPFDFPAAMMASRGPIALVQSANPDELASSSAQTRSEPPSPPDGVVEAAPASAAAIIKELRTATVTRGDSLWRLSRKMLGRGIRYTQIYIANSGQIRDPRLVFPGQVFVMPQDPI